MNPDETNPTTNTGTTGGGNAGSVVPPALDFTSSETTSLSMADSLASAADNLTSAGMAAKEPDTGSIAMNEIGASDPSAQMERPDEPLVPAAPVPGSIGSVTSGPAVAAHDDTPASGFGTSNAAGTSGASAFGASNASGLGTPTASGFGTSTTSGFGAASGASFGAPASAAGNMPTATNTSTGFGGATAGAGATAPVSSATTEPYNPFAAKMGTSTGANASGAQTSSMNVPAGSQPVTEKFSAKLPSASAAKKPGMLTVILGILAVVSLIMAIVFAVLWQNAEANKNVVYDPTPTPSDGGANQTVALLTCTKDLGTDEAEILAGLVNHNLAATANFSNDQLGSVTMLNRYTFVDAIAAAATQEHFGGTLAWYGTVAEGAGVTATPSTLDVAGTTATLSLSATPAQLVGDYASLFGLTAGADGKVDTSRESIQANYEANGFACVED